jgi:hypothetical protein
LPFPSPTGLQRLLAKPLDKVVGKGTLLAKLACFAGKKAQLRQQLCPMLLAKLGNIFFLFFCCFLAFKPHV